MARRDHGTGQDFRSDGRRAAGGRLRSRKRRRGGVPELLFAYEVNPSAWTDGQLHIPESGNGLPDLLDEVRWELDFYLRMQRPDGHFLTSIKGHNATVTSPPSASDEERMYFDTTSPSSSEWSAAA